MPRSSRVIGALQPLLHPYLHWVQADGQVARGRTKVIGMLQAIGISGAPGVRRLARRPGLPLVGGPAVNTSPINS